MDIHVNRIWITAAEISSHTLYVSMKTELAQLFLIKESVAAFLNVDQ